MNLPKAHFFCCFLFFLFFSFFIFFFRFLPQFFPAFFQKVSSFGSPQFGSETFPFGWSPVHLAGVSLNIGRFSSASRVHLGLPFSSLMFPLSSAQVLLPCPGLFDVSMCAAFGTFPFPWLHLIGLYSPHMMSPPSNLHWFFPCIFHLSNLPFQIAFVLSIFPPFAIFAPFQLAFCFPIFSALVMCASFRIAFSSSIFFIVSPFFSRCKHPRTSAIRQHMVHCSMSIFYI